MEIKNGYYRLSVKALILDSARTKFLLVQEDNGKWELPGGGLDWGESPQDGVAREIREEIGVQINPNDMEVVHVMHRKASNDERIDFFMVASKYSGEITNMEPEKCDDLQFFPLNNLPVNVIEYIKVAIENYRNGIVYSEYGW
jgi:ADP-ribose pyrophosphatase YjhB (NUDIX family)